VIFTTECDNFKGFHPAVKGKKRKFAEELTSPEFDGNITKLCERYGIHRSTYYRWLNEWAFKDYCDWLVQMYANSELANVWRAMIKCATEKQDVQAQKLYFELLGKYTKKLEATGNIGVVVISGEEELDD